MLESHLADCLHIRWHSLLMPKPTGAAKALGEYSGGDICSVDLDR